MPSPSGTFSTLANIAIALGGFSGIVISLGHRALGSLTPLESRRLFNLFTFSGLVLMVALLNIALLHVKELDRSLLWRCDSALLFATGLPWLIFDWWKVVRLSPVERAKVHPLVIYPFTLLAIAALALQAVNLFLWGQVWPIFVALVAQLSFAFQQFILLIRSGLRR